MYRPTRPEHNPCTTRACWSLRADRPRASQGGHHGGLQTSRRAVTPSRWESSPTRRARSRSSGLANANVARMVIGDINAKGGLLGRHLELCLEDSATDDAVAAAAGGQAGRARQRRRRLRWHLQLHAAGHQGPGRRRGQDALHLPRAVRGAGVRSAHLLHRPGAGAAGRPVHPVADAARPGRRRSTCRRPTTSGPTC